MMNKRMVELFGLAGGTVTVLDGAVLTYTNEFDPEKFAELIIRECVDVCRKENWKTLGQDTKGMKQFDRGIIAGRKSMSYDLCDKIEERFGI